jgi:hypothetical protein
MKQIKYSEFKASVDAGKTREELMTIYNLTKSELKTVLVSTKLNPKRAVKKTVEVVFDTTVDTTTTTLN